MCMLINVPTLPAGGMDEKPFSRRCHRKEDDHIRGLPCPLTGRDNLLESGLHYRGKSFRYLLNIT